MPGSSSNPTDLVNQSAPGGAVTPAAETFATTQWSVVLAAGTAGSPRSQEAMEQLCRTYWYPLYAYLRRRGAGPEDAQDLTQSFFARLLDRNILASASPLRGRFRTFLLTAIRNFASDQHARATARKRGSGDAPLALDALEPEARYALEPADVESPDLLFERRWATTVLENAWGRLAQDYAAEGRGDLFAELRRFNSVQGAPSYADAAARLGLPENTVKSLVHRMRQRYRAILRQEIAQTVDSPAEVDEEIRHLLRVLGS